MSSTELTNWTAYERVYGPILVHERIDVGLAQLQWLVTRLWASKNKLTPRDFMPPWYQELTKGAHRRPDAIRQGFEALMGMAEKDEG
jgi:hypothetical protein